MKCKLIAYKGRWTRNDRDGLYKRKTNSIYITGFDWIQLHRCAYTY